MPTSKPRLLFIDRDGTLVREPADEQVDAIEKVTFLPHVFTALRHIAKLPFVPVMVSNQDGLGTAAFPEETFHPVNDLILRALAAEDFHFHALHIDRTFPADGAPTRKPGTAMLGEYLKGGYDLAGSYVIGDRATDAQLAVNLGCRALLLRDPDRPAEKLTAEQQAAVVLTTTDWDDIAAFLRHGSRTGTVKRTTAETDIAVCVDLDGLGKTRIDTGLHFFDHMLAQLPHHAGLSLDLVCHGDLEVDEHHTMEDVAIALGEALREALGDKRGIERYGFVLPMDECDATVALDLGGRIDFSWDVPFTREYVGDTPTEMFRHFFYSLACALQCNLHIRARGENNHHLIEGVFKAFARAMRQAIRRDPYSDALPSSKGVI